MRRIPVTGISVIALAVAMLSSAPAQANLLVNGDFEISDNGFSTTLTPVGWTNIGHSDGVVAYSTFNTPAYDGLYFYDLGGFGDPLGSTGDGIQQTVATTTGVTYRLTFGLSSEDVAGDTTLRVTIDGLSTDFPLTSAGTFLGKGFTTQTIDYVATGATTTISFITAASTNLGNNDPMIDRVIFEAVNTAVPEPTSLALLAGGLAGLVLLRRRKQLTADIERARP
ncbi:MAG: DUF642 domain-containing protein [Alphaproteobacteria bacterium]